MCVKVVANTKALLEGWEVVFQYTLVGMRHQYNPNKTQHGESKTEPRVQ